MPVDTPLWTRCLRALQGELPEQDFNTWIRPLQAVEDGGSLKLLAPNRFVVDWLRQHYLARIREIATGAGHEAEIMLEVGSRAAAESPPAEPATVASAARVPAPKHQTVVSRLSPAFTFPNFVEGKSNQLARAAALQQKLSRLR